MRKTIIFGALAAMLGLTAVAQASDDDRVNVSGAGQVTQERANDGRYGDRDDRYERREDAHGTRDHDDDRDGRHERRERRSHRD